MDYIKEYTKLAKNKNLLPIKVTDFYMKKIDEEIKNIWFEGPLYRNVFPVNDKINLVSYWEVEDWVDDRLNEQINYWKNIIRKYKNRILVLVTQVCVWHCLYCFRQDVLSEKLKLRESIDFIDLAKNLLELIKNDSDIDEIILSWWDPMTLPINKLEYILKLIRNNSCIKNIRIHTRSIVYNPYIFNDTLLDILQKYNVRLVFHINHPYEVCDVVKDFINRIQYKWIRCYNQFPLLRKTNDNWIVLNNLLSILDELNIRNLSIFIPDPITYSASYRINFSRILKIIDELNLNTSAWINSTRFVMDTVIWKVRRENADKSYRKWYIKFTKNWKFVNYPDFPKEYDIPWDLEKMLWKDYNFNN